MFFLTFLFGVSDKNPSQYLWCLLSSLRHSRFLTQRNGRQIVVLQVVATCGLVGGCQSTRRGKLEENDLNSPGFYFPSSGKNCNSVSRYMRNTTQHMSR